MNDPQNMSDPSGAYAVCGANFGQECTGMGIEWFAGAAGFIGKQLSSWLGNKEEGPIRKNGMVVITTDMWNRYLVNNGMEPCGDHLECITGDWSTYTVPEDPYMKLGALGLVALWFRCGGSTTARKTSRSTYETSVAIPRIVFSGMFDRLHEMTIITHHLSRN